MKLILRLTLSLLTFAQTAMAQVEKRPGLHIIGEGHAYEIMVSCASADCNQVEIKYGPAPNTITAPPKSKEVLKVSLSEISNYVAKASIPKEYLLPSIPKDFQFDPAAGGLNIFLPAIWIAAVIVGIPYDAIELLSNQNKSVLKSIENLKKQLQTAAQSNRVMMVRMEGPKASRNFARMIELIEGAALAQEKRSCKIVVEHLAD